MKTPLAITEEVSARVGCVSKLRYQQYPLLVVLNNEDYPESPKPEDNQYLVIAESQRADRSLYASY